MDKSYRRGMLLGFTLAELTILLLFAAILILGGIASMLAKSEENEAELRAGATVPMVPKSELDLQAEQVRELQAEIARLKGEAQGKYLVSSEKFDLLQRLLQLGGGQLPETVNLATNGPPLKSKLYQLTSVQIDLLGQLDKYGLAPKTTQDVSTLVGRMGEKRRSDQPPIITLSEAERQYSFARGSAELSPEFVASIRRDIVRRIAEIGDQHAARVIEVVGHTDEEAVSPDRVTNLDKSLLPYLVGMPSNELRAKDNVGLGMARAAAVARLLAAEPGLKCFTVLPMSAGQTVEAEKDALAKPGPVATTETDPRRRRIEIRLRPFRTGTVGPCHD